MARPKKRIVTTVVIVAVALCATAFALDRATLQATYARVPDQKVSLLPRYELYEQDYPRSDVEFQLDGTTLRGHVYGQDNTCGLIVFRHGMFSKHEDYLPFITAMVDRGWRVFAYDAIGCGESDGESTLGMSQSPLDVTAAVNYAQEAGLAKEMPLVLWGHSWGGYGVAAALAQCPDVDACVTMSGFDTPMKELDASAVSSYGLLGKIQWPFLWLNTTIDFGSNANVSASDAIASADVPTLVIHGSGDTTVPYDGVSILDNVEKRWQGLSGKKISTVTLAEEGRNGHNDYFYTRESQAYLNKCAADLQALLDENDDDVSAPEVLAYLEGVDLLRANTADPELLDEIEDFLKVYV